MSIINKMTLGEELSEWLARRIMKVIEINLVVISIDIFYE